MEDINMLPALLLIEEMWCISKKIWRGRLGLHYRRMQTPVIEVDLELALDAITPKFIRVLKQMARLSWKQKPVFEARNLYVANSLSSFKDKHVRFLVGQMDNESVFQTVGFDLSSHYNGYLVATSLECIYDWRNTYNGMTSIQLRAKDIKFE